MPVCVVAYVTLYVMYMYLKVRNTLWQAKPGSHAKAERPLHVTPLAHLACRETRLRPCLSGSSIVPWYVRPFSSPTIGCRCIERANGCVCTTEPYLVQCAMHQELTCTCCDVCHGL